MILLNHSGKLFGAPLKFAPGARLLVPFPPHGTQVFRSNVHKIFDGKVAQSEDVRVI